MKKLKYKYISICDDPELTLKDAKKRIEELIEQHGEDAVLSIDAGYNNATVDLKVDV